MINLKSHGAPFVLYEESIVSFGKLYQCLVYFRKIITITTN
ncbi:hypothetical protein N0B40_15085 [Chryseobacterium oranimense]|nr:hypothetical protein [Chryseobacterium oranimense]UWX59732.1 hypothetical protein N0B40_15085 [Chryseobacterium oranimense]